MLAGMLVTGFHLHAKCHASVGHEVTVINTIQAFKLILITAQQPGEVARMHTNEIDGTIWTIPAERSKNGEANRVYLYWHGTRHYF